jgi:hypothetical protein
VGASLIVSKIDHASVPSFCIHSRGRQGIDVVAGNALLSCFEKAKRWQQAVGIEGIVPGHGNPCENGWEHLENWGKIKVKNPEDVYNL